MVDITVRDVQNLVKEGLAHRFWVVPPGNGWYLSGYDHYVIYPTLGCEWIDERIHLLVSNSRKKSYFYGMSFGNRLELPVEDVLIDTHVERENQDMMDTIKKVLKQYVKQAVTTA